MGLCFQYRNRCIDKFHFFGKAHNNFENSCHDLKVVAIELYHPIGFSQNISNEYCWY